MVNLNTDNPISRDLMNQCNIGTLENELCVQIGKDVLSELVPENEAAVDEPDETTDMTQALTDAEEMGCFSPTVGMAQIKGVFDDRLFALHYIDEQGNHSFKFCERYRTGAFSPQMSIAQAELILLNNCGFNLKLISVPTLRATATRIMSNLTLDYFNKFSGSEPIDMAKILQVLMQVRNQLPIRKDLESEYDSKAFYLRIMEVIEKDASLDVWLKRNTHKSYYAFVDEALELLAEKIGMNVKELLKKLNDYGFLYLTKSSNGLKTKVRFKGIKKGKSAFGDAMREEFGMDDTYTDWAYCIWKLQNIGELRK